MFLGGINILSGIYNRSGNAVWPFNFILGVVVCVIGVYGLVEDLYTFLCR